MRDERSPSLRRRSGRGEVGRCRCEWQAPVHPLRQRKHVALASAHDRFVDGRPGGDRTGLAAEDRAVDGERAADGDRSSDRRVAADSARGSRRRSSRPGSVRTRDARHGRGDRTTATRTAGGPGNSSAGSTQRCRLRQRLRDRGSIPRRRLTQPDHRHDQRPKGPGRRRHRADPHQRRAWAAKYDGSPVVHR